MDGGDMDHSLVFLSHEVCRNGWWCHGSFSALSVTMRSTAEGGGDMDLFLVFLSLSRLPRWIEVTWTIFWSFCHREVCRNGWR